MLELHNRKHREEPVMKLEYIREFVKLAEIGNYMQTADEIFIAQSALSRHIQSLEQELDCKLFDRTTHKVRLTESGDCFLPFAKEILKTQSEYEEALAQLRNTQSNVVRIGCFPVADCYGIPEIISSFTLEHPNIMIDLYRDDNLADLKAKTVDMIFYRECEERDDSLVYLPLSSDQLVAIVSLDHPLANMGTVEITQLKNDRFLLLPNNTSMHKLCMKVCADHGFKPALAYSGSYVNIILELVKIHTGIALLTEKPLASHNMSGLAVLKIEPEVQTPISLVYQKNRALSYATKTFLRFVQKYLISNSNYNG